MMRGDESHVGRSMLALKQKEPGGNQIGGGMTEKRKKLRKRTLGIGKGGSTEKREDDDEEEEV